MESTSGEHASPSLLRRGWRFSKRIYRRLFRFKHHVFVRHGPYEPEERPDCRFERYDSIEQIPDFVREAIHRQQSAEAFEKDLKEMADGSIMWVAIADGVVAGARHSRRGSAFRQWFVPLKENDVVIFRGRTFPEFRGRGLSPSMHRHIMHSELGPEDAAYADCAVDNWSSQRSFQKAGYQLIATMRPISRESALGK